MYERDREGEVERPVIRLPSFLDGCVWICISNLSWEMQDQRLNERKTTQTPGSRVNTVLKTDEQYHYK